VTKALNIPRITGTHVKVSPRGVSSFHQEIHLLPAFPNPVSPNNVTAQWRYMRSIEAFDFMAVSNPMGQNLYFINNHIMSYRIMIYGPVRSIVIWTEGV